MHITLFITTTITEAFSEFIKIQILPAVSHINIIKAHLRHAIIIILTLQGIVISFMQLNEGLETLTSQAYHSYHLALQ